MAYFLVSVSNRKNLELCIKYSLAGFTSSISGFWTFVEIREGDYVSFLYGARVFNLYKVVRKEALKNAEKLPPWQPITFSTSGRTYYFPFRVYLKPLRKLNEPMVRPEFAYVAENLLLRGGYRKTHFQADSVTLYNVSQMGELYSEPVEELKIDISETFSPALTFNKSSASPPEIFYFQEIILQSLVRHYLSQYTKLQRFFENLNLKDYKAEEFEVLGEKAFPEGHVDIFIKDLHPKERSRKIIVEVKRGNAKIQDLAQLKSYMDELREECVKGILIARKFSKDVLNKLKQLNIAAFLYSFENLNMSYVYSFNELQEKLNIITLEGEKV